MRMLVGIAAVVLIALILQDAFETMVLPRRVTRRLRLSRLFVGGVWRAGNGLAGWIYHLHRIFGKPRHSSARDSYLAIIFGPISLILLLILWAIGLIFGFALLQWAIGSQLHSPEGLTTFGVDLYLSGTTFFTLGLGDVTPLSPVARIITVIEGGTGFGFLALVIGYLPMLYQSFARREETVSLLDARAGSPPSAIEILRRCVTEKAYLGLDALLLEWERWSAQVLESHLSYPVLAYFRSQHENQSWLAALTAILDACALVLTGLEGVSPRQAQLTFAMGRHTVVDLSAIFYSPPRQMLDDDRLPPEQWDRLRAALAAAGLRLHDEEGAYLRLKELRKLYEPYVSSLDRNLMMPLAPWLPEDKAQDAWETSPFETVTDVGMVKP
jgi:Ion channel